MTDDLQSIPELSQEELDALIAPEGDIEDEVFSGEMEPGPDAEVSAAPAAPVDPPTTETTVVAEPEVVVVAPAATPAPPSEPSIQAPAVQVVAQAAPAPTPSAPAAPVYSGPPVPTGQQVAERRQSLLNELTERYKVSEQEEVELITEPGKVMPRLMARAMLDGFEAAVVTMSQQLPSMIDTQTQQREVQRSAMAKAEEAFYGKWPALKAPEHREIVMRMATAYHQAYPQASLEQAVQEVGASVVAVLGARLPSPPIAPATPSAPVQTHNPIAPRGSAGAVLPAATDNPFAKMAEEFSLD